MLTPADIKDMADAWWAVPGPLHLDVLAARVAAHWVEVGAIVRVRIEHRAGPVHVVVVELERDQQVSTREWTPPVGQRPETLDDVRDAALGGLSARGTHVLPSEESV